MSRPPAAPSDRPAGRSSSVQRRRTRRRLAVAALIGCGAVTTAAGCGAARQRVMRPVVGTLRAVPGVNRLMPAPRRPAAEYHFPAPSDGPIYEVHDEPAEITPPPRLRPEPDLSSGWERTPGEIDLPPLPADPPPTLDAPRPLPGGGRTPTRLSPPTDPAGPFADPAEPLSPIPDGPDEGAAAPPAPAPAPEDPSAYYPVGRGRGPMASLWKRVSDLSPLRRRPAATPTRLVSHEADASAAAETPATDDADRTPKASGTWWHLFGRRGTPAAGGRAARLGD